MNQYTVDDSTVDLVEELAKPQRFESFAEALRRLLTELRQLRNERRPTKEKAEEWTVDQLFAELDALPDAVKVEEPYTQNLEKLVERRQQITRHRAASPDARGWLSGVPELRAVPTLTSWKAICDHLKIEVGGDSARRALQKWVRKNRPKWPQVPEV